jgi:hypothetical protein
MPGSIRFDALVLFLITVMSAFAGASSDMRSGGAGAVVAAHRQIQGH